MQLILIGYFVNFFVLGDKKKLLLADKLPGSIPGATRFSE
jgi:hypothetical protein